MATVSGFTPVSVLPPPPQAITSKDTAIVKYSRIDFMVSRTTEHASGEYGWPAAVPPRP
jgi:hypothetical protein